MNKIINCGGTLLLALALLGCPGGETPESSTDAPAADAADNQATTSEMDQKVNQYTSFRLTTDLGGLSDQERQILPLLIDAAKEMDAAFWLQAYTGDRDDLLTSIDNPAGQRYAEINYGPWDRLDGDAPFIDGVGPKPLGANFYPLDMTKEEFEETAAGEAGDSLRSLYSLVRRDENGALMTVPYSVAYADHYQKASEKLKAAAELAEDAGLKKYLELRAEALLNDEYLASDLAWMDMKTNTIDFVVGPIETYEDKLFGYKAANSAYVLIKDQNWSARLARYADFLPELQKGLPVPDEYKQEKPGSDSDLNAYDVIYYAGDCNAGSKTIAINLPNDERVQLEKGTRRLQLKNAMRAKFDKILVPIADVLIAEDQRANITFDAFFANTMFHEVAHGLGIKNTLTGKGTVRKALQDKASALEEGKADILGLYMVTRLHEKGELGDAALLDNYATFLAGIFRSVRFGASSSHGVANMIRFNFFEEMGAFSRDDETGHYRVDFEKMQQAMDALSEKILRFQGDGDYEGVVAFVEQYGQVGAALKADLDRLASAGIPVDVVFEQGVEVLGL